MSGGWDRRVRLRVAVALTDGDRLLLVQHEKNGERYWLLPGGGVEWGETLSEAAAREVEEETGLSVGVGRLFLLCEAIDPGGRHIVNLCFAGAVTAGSLRLGADSALCDTRWIGRDEVAGLAFRPPITTPLLEAWAERFAGPVRVLGNVWRPPGPRD